jgi:hypothetical protein
MARACLETLCAYTLIQRQQHVAYILCVPQLHRTPMFLLYNKLQPNKLQQQQQQFFHSFKPAAVLLIMTTNKLLPKFVHQQTN